MNQKYCHLQKQFYQKHSDIPEALEGHRIQVFSWARTRRKKRSSNQPMGRLDRAGTVSAELSGERRILPQIR